MNYKETFKTIINRIRTLVDLHNYMDTASAIANVRANLAFKGPNTIILLCAIVIASLGLNVNSVAVIIGAMLISPLMTPIVGVGMGVGTKDTTLIRLSLKHLGIMVGISIMASALFFLISPLDLEHPTELMARTNPTLYDVLIALFGGFAGVIELSRKEKGTVLSGVAIATALMPPLCTVGYGIAAWEPRHALGAFYLFFINSVFIALATLIGTKLLSYPVVKNLEESTNRKGRALLAVMLVIIIIPSTISGYKVITDNAFSRRANSFIDNCKSVGSSYIYDYTLHTDETPSKIELFVAGNELTDADREEVYRKAGQYDLSRDQIIFTQDAIFGSDIVKNMKILEEIIKTNEQRTEMLMRENQELRSMMDSLMNDSIVSE